MFFEGLFFMFSVLFVLKDGNAKAVEILFSYYYDELRDKQLLVLSNFPETLDTYDYERLLPRIE